MVDPLIAAALRDQERRVLEATPRQIDGQVFYECRACGGKLRPKNRSGFCSQTAACRNAGVQDYRKRHGRKG